MQKNQKGLTLIELLAVIAIIAILFILLIPQISNAFEKARLAGVKTDLNDYRTAATSYFNETEGEDKTSENFNRYLDKKLQFSDNYSKELNPWSNPYILEISEDKQSLVIKTHNKDKNPKEYSLLVSRNSSGELSFETSGFANPIVSSKNQNPSGANDDSNNNSTEETCNVTNATDESFFTTETIEGGVKITAYEASGPKDVSIPCQIGGKDVIDIGDSAFKSKSLTSVIFPDTLKSISGNSSFYNNQLTSVVIPDSVSTIGPYSFRSNKIATLELSDSIKILPLGSFLNNKLTSFTVPEKLEKIEIAALEFNNISTYYVDPKNQNFKTDPLNSAIYSDDGRRIFFGTARTFETAEYNSVGSIETSAFSGLGLTEVLIPEGVESIEGHAFSSNKITNLTLPESLIFIGYNAFDDNELTSVTIPSGVIEIEMEAFYNNYIDMVFNHSTIPNDEIESLFNSYPTILN